MRPKPKRSNFMPVGKYETVESPGVDAVCYTYQGEDGAPYGMGFKGKAAKPSFHYRFRSAESRAAHVEKFLDERARWVEATAKQKKERKGFLSSWAQGAASIRVELAQLFPGIKFSVTSEGYSQGCSINVRWEFGPTEAQVEEILKKYSYNDHGPDPEGSAFRDANGSARFVSANRCFPKVVWEGICKAIAKLKGVEYTDIHQSFNLGSEGYISLTTYAHRTMNRVAFPPGVTELTCAVDLVVDWSEEFKRDGTALVGDEFQIIYPGAVMIPRDTSTPEPSQPISQAAQNVLRPEWEKMRAFIEETDAKLADGGDDSDDPTSVDYQIPEETNELARAIGAKVPGKRRDHLRLVS